MYRIEMVCGHSGRYGDELEPRRIADAETAILYAFADWFQGARMRREQGSYRMNDGRTIVEQCSVICCDTTNLEPEQKRLLQKLASEIAESLDQETVYLAITETQGEQHWIAPVLVDAVDVVKKVTGTLTSAGQWVPDV